MGFDEVKAHQFIIRSTIKISRVVSYPSVTRGLNHRRQVLDIKKKFFTLKILQSKDVREFEKKFDKDPATALRYEKMYTRAFYGSTKLLAKWS